MKKIIYIILLILPVFAFGQAPTGPTLVCPNTLNTYTTSWGGYDRITWSATNGTFSGTTLNATSVQAKFTADGSIKVTFSAKNDPGLTPPYIVIGTYTTNVTVKTVGTLSGPSSTCSSSSTTVLRNGGNMSSYSWQVSPAGAGSWTQFSTTTSSMASTTISQNSDFRIVSNECATSLVTNTVTVPIQSAPTAGVITGSTSICSGTAPSAITSTTNPGPGSVYVVWKQRVGGGSWTDVPGVYQGWGFYSYTPGTLTQTTDYKMVSKWGCDNNYAADSNIITITVNPVTSIGTFSANPAGACGASSITVSASSLTSTSTQWQVQYSDNGGSSYSGWTNYSTSNTSPTVYSATPNGNQNRIFQFRVLAKNGACSQTTSSTSTVNVYSSVAGTVTPSQVEAYSPASGSFTVSALPSGAVFQKWQQSDNGSTWTDPGYNTSLTYYYNYLNSSKWYRVVATNGPCTIYSTGRVIVSPAPQIAIQGGGEPTLPIGSTLTLQSVNTYFTYQWIKDEVDIPGATNATYTVVQPGNYKLRVKSSATATTATTSAFPIYALGYAPGGNYNSITTTVFKKAGITPSTNLYTSGLQPSEYAQSILYTDGLARNAQGVSVGQSPAGKDLIQPFSYDSSKVISLLPFASLSKVGWFDASALTNQASFYQSPPSGIASSTAPYAVATIEKSPAQRYLESGAPGSEWQPGGGHTAKTEFQVNASNDVRIITASGPNGYYPLNTLGVTKVTDEDGNATYTYTNRSGQQILTRVQENVATYLETYNVYDTRGNLIIQIPPKASSLLSSVAWSNAFRDQHCYVYNYDGRNRLIEKKVPDAAWTYYIYDQLDRMVLMQDGNSRPAKKWLFIKYDIKSRAVLSGYYTNTTTLDRATLQGTVNDLYKSSNVSFPEANYFENRGTTLHGYTNVSFPNINNDAGSTALEVLTVNYYDNYDFDFNGSDDYSYTSQGISGEGSQASAFSLPTGSKKIIIGTSNWLYSYVFYDKLAQIIQTRTNNQLSLVVDNLATTIYDFDGKPVLTKNYQNAGGTNQTTIVTKMIYDHAGRVTKELQNINNQPSDQVLAKITYNELGQVVSKDLHSNGSEVYLQSVDYRYNIRGWLKSINNAQLNVSSNNDDTNDYFGMEFLYSEADAGLSNIAAFNGNISAIKWKGAGQAAGNTDQRSYKFTYDKSSKLTSAAYKKYGTVAWNAEVGMLDEFQDYDKNGNIVSLTRNRIRRGVTTAFVPTATSEVLDALSYTYSSGFSNQLQKVEDSGLTDGFNNANAGSTDYSYGDDGSMKSDLNKGITMTYNLLGKPDVISTTGSPSKTVTYTYDGTGTKLKTVTYDGTNTITTHYINGVVYENSNLSFITTLEGRAVKNGSNFEYQYFISDHQGNTRVVFSSVAPSPDTYTATFEDNTIATESSTFSNYPTGGGRSSLELFDHTDISGTTYSRSQLLNGGNNSQVGLAKSIKVYPGDQIHAEVYAKYWNQTSTTSNVSAFAAALTGAFGLTSGMSGEALKAFNALDNYGGIVAAAGGSGNDNTAPKAFINILLFDQNFRFVDAAFDQMSTDGEQGASSPKGPFDKLFRDVVVKEPGYAFIYISNENPTQVDVYFDDLSITRTKSNVIQYNEYYPFGALNQNSWTREGSKTNNFLYNDGSELNAITGLYDTPYRGYDPTLARFLQVDPVASFTPNLSVYGFANDNPILLNDPTGALTRYLVWTDRGPQLAPMGRMDERSNGYGEGYPGPSMFGTTYDWVMWMFYNLPSGTKVVQNEDGEWGYWTGGVLAVYPSPPAGQAVTPEYIAQFIVEPLEKIWNKLSVQSPEDIKKDVNDYNFLLGTGASAIETGLGATQKALERVRVVSGQARNGAYIVQTRSAVSLANRANYITTANAARGFNVAGKLVAGGVLAYNAVDLTFNGGTNQDWAKLGVQGVITGIGFLGPVGFGVSVALTLIEVNGGFQWFYDNFDNTTTHVVTQSSPQGYSVYSIKK